MTTAGKASRYNSVRHEGGRLFNVGILADGSLYNPNGYPADVVRAAVLAADIRRHERASQAAKKVMLYRCYEPERTAEERIQN